MNTYKNLAVLNGALIAIMIFFNSVLSENIGLYLSVLIYHVLGFILILLVSVVRKNKLPKLSKIPVIFFIPGILSVLTIFLNNLSSHKIGITVTAGMGLFGQFAISALIDHFGLFGVQVNKMTKKKTLSFSIIITGLIFMILL